ncbi:MAG: DUF6125 family protein [Actinomycetota bacterium]|nr:DUF6125 family protein [Actinomycetota bacterium]
MDELRLGALTAIDGLWFLEAEVKFGFEQAFVLALDIWKNYGIVILRRLSRILGLSLDKDTPDPQTVNFLMETLCHVDGTECEG